jgi:hypothetical protein
VGRDNGVVPASLDRVLETGDGYLEAPDASQAIAAVEAMPDSREIGARGTRIARRSTTGSRMLI